MSYNRNFPQPLSPLSAGNVVSAALRLYRDHFKTYFKVSLIAGLWSICPLVVFLIIILINSLILTSGNLSGYFFIFINLLVAIAIFVYCSAKYFTNIALISRLAFSELINQPETTTQARRQVQPKIFIFWKAKLLAGFLLFLINLGLSLVQALVFILPFNNNSSPLGSLWQLIGNLIYLAAYTWFYSRLMFVELPLAVEEEMLGAKDTVERSWLLSKGLVWRIALITTVAFLITIPIYFLSFLPIIIIFMQLVYTSINSFNSDIFSPSMLISILIIILFFFIAFILINILIVPFWQAIKSVIYYDLRSRQEGLGIEIRTIFKSNDHDSPFSPY